LSFSEVLPSPFWSVGGTHTAAGSSCTNTCVGADVDVGVGVGVGVGADVDGDVDVDAGGIIIVYTRFFLGGFALPPPTPPLPPPPSPLLLAVVAVEAALVRFVFVATTLSAFRFLVPNPAPSALP
jgi:hypothetical protein